MWKYVFKRILLTIPIVIGVIFVVFALLHFAPGDITIQILGNKWTQEGADAIRHQLGLDLPFFVQFFKYLGGILHGDFGVSYISNEPVVDMIRVSFPNTAILVLTSTIMAVVISIPIGIIAAVKPNSVFSGFTTIFSLIGISAPGFWIGLLLMLFFSLQLGWLPSSGLDSWKSLILPTIVMSICHLAALSRTTRSSMIESLSMDYIRTARAKGVKEKVIILKHALNNALLPTITLVGIIVGETFGGATVCETVFSIPGMGRLLVDSVNKRDIYPVLGCVSIMAVCVAVSAILADVAFAFFDPRIKAQYVGGGKSNG